jgi:DNA-binding HxlR family transcriptional regulator
MSKEKEKGKGKGKGKGKFEPEPDDIKYVQDTLYVIGGKWKLLIMLSLAKGNKRFRDIQRSIPKITSRMLSKELKELEMNKIITRTVYDDSPVSVNYEITTYCKSFDPIIQELIDWGKNHRAYITGKKK